MSQHVGREMREWKDEIDVVTNIHTRGSSTLGTISGEGAWWETRLSYQHKWMDRLSETQVR